MLSETPEDLETAEGAQDAMVIGELRNLMEDKKVYREEGITIHALADKLKVREYRLRRLINGHLGYRSLSPFNKAFKEINGMTPTEYRNSRLAVKSPPVETKALPLGRNIYLHIEAISL